MTKSKTLDMVKYRKNYYEDHKEEYKQTETCDICGGKYQIWNKAQHKKTQKHKKIMEMLDNQQKIKQELDELKGKIKKLV
jgi:hypothetical protein